MKKRLCIGIFLTLFFIFHPRMVISENSINYIQINISNYNRCESRATAVYITPAENTSYEYQADTENKTIARIWMKIVCEKYNPLETVTIEPEAETGGWEHSLVPDTIEVTENGQSEHPFVLILIVPPMEKNTTKEIMFSGSYIALGGGTYKLPETGAEYTFFVNETLDIREESKNEVKTNGGFSTVAVITIIGIALILVLISIEIFWRRKRK